jgi:hypothetical protein
MKQAAFPEIARSSGAHQCQDPLTVMSALDPQTLQRLLTDATLRAYLLRAIDDLSSASKGQEEVEFVA